MLAGWLIIQELTYQIIQVIWAKVREYEIANKLNGS